METSIAVLMADLSGFTALTEVHGAQAAIQVIEKYTELAEASLIGESILQERTGDQLMMISSIADDLALTAINLIRNTRKEPRFLHTHAGLHYGPTIKQAGRFFGSTINLAARITATAGGGKILCSREFMDALSDPDTFSLHPRGLHQFKNVMGSKEIYELLPELVPDEQIRHKDPVCHMQLTHLDISISHLHLGRMYYFCSDGCKDLFIKHIQEFTSHTV